MNYQLFIGGTLLAGCAAAHTAQSQTAPGSNPAAARPNIVFILADDLGYGDLSCYGQRHFETPNIDAIARNGMRFTQCYSGTTVSAPSRSCLLTGQHSGHTPIRGNKEAKPEGQFPLPDGASEIFLNMKQAGYTVGVFGKWGLGFIGTSGDPMRQGVDRFYGYNCQLLAHSYYPDHLWDDSTRVELTDNVPEVPYGQGSYAPDLIHAEAMKFLDSRKEGEPFMLFYPTTLPHAELIVPEDDIIQSLRGRYPETPFKGCDSGPAFRHGGYCSQPYPHATFAAMIVRLDRYVGEIVEHLRQRNMLDNTVIIFASDNGPHLEGGADPDFFNGNGPFRGYKRDVYEGGIRVPMIVSWPGHIEAGSTSDHMCAFWDLPATFAELTGGAMPSTEDGISFMPTLTGNADQQLQHDYLYFEFLELNGRQAVRCGDWKLIHMDIRGDNPHYELYNLADDIGEQHNLIDKQPEVAACLKALMNASHTPDANWPLLPGERAAAQAKQ